MQSFLEWKREITCICIVVFVEGTTFNLVHSFFVAFIDFESNVFIIKFEL